MKKIKNYLVFTSVLYRILTYVLLPTLTVGLYYLLRNVIPEVGLVAIMEMVVLAEIVLDLWLFGGIQSKDTLKLEYLKTSARGMGVLKDALRMDLLRRLLTIAGILCICFFLEGKKWEGTEMAGIRIYLILLGYTLSTLGILVGRFEGHYWTNVLIGYAAVVLGIASFFLPGLRQFIMIYNLVLIVLAVFISILAVKMAMKKVEGSYHDA